MPGVVAGGAWFAPERDFKPTHAVFISTGGRGGEKHGFSRAPSVTGEAHHAHKPNPATRMAGRCMRTACGNSGRDKTPLFGGGCVPLNQGVFQSPGLSTCGNFSTVFGGLINFLHRTERQRPPAHCLPCCAAWVQWQGSWYGFSVQPLQGWVQGLQGWVQPLHGYADGFPQGTGTSGGGQSPENLGDWWGGVSPGHGQQEPATTCG